MEPLTNFGASTAEAPKDTKIINRRITFVGPVEKVNRQIRSSLPDGIYPGLAGGVKMIIRTAGNEGELEEIRFDSALPGQMEKPEPQFCRGREGLTVQAQMRLAGDGIRTFQAGEINIELSPTGTLRVYVRETGQELGRLELGTLEPSPKP